MTIQEQYEQETGLKATLSHFGLPDDYSTRYVQWLESKLAQKPESEAMNEAAEEWAGWTTIANGPKHTAIAAFIAGAEWMEAKAQEMPRKLNSDAEYWEVRNGIKSMLIRLWNFDPDKAELMTCQILNGFEGDGFEIIRKWKKPE